MRLSPLKVAFGLSLLVHGIILSVVYVVRHGNVSAGSRFAQAETHLLEIVVESEPMAASPSAAPPTAVNAALPTIEPIAPIPEPTPTPLPANERSDMLVDDREREAFVEEVARSTSEATDESNPGVPVAVTSAFVSSRASYSICPKPAYPKEARRRKQQGLVILMVSVSPEGLPSRVEVKTSSGFAILDEAAAEAVARWQFIPASIGHQTMNSLVEIPVRFKLSD